jgi:GntR family transcriptional regulator, galactonate operon transcriptional repressor
MVHPQKMAQMAPTKPRKNLHKQIVDEIGLSIVRGDVKPGETFPSEPELSVQLGVSRTVVREAMKILSDKGMVQSRAKLGTQIQPRDQWNLLDPDVLSWESSVDPHEEFLYKLTEVRRVIEPQAARFAAERGTDEEVAIIAQCYEQMETLVDDVDAFIPVDMQFHSGILRAAHNEILEHIINTTREALVTSRKVTLALPNSGRQSLPLHHDILKAIQARDAAGAQKAMEALINSVKDDIDRSVEIDKVHQNTN